LSSIALFDFDGTITNEDSLIAFIRYAKGDLSYLMGIILLSPMLVLFKLKIIPNYKAKAWMISYFFKGMPFETFRDFATKFSLEHIDGILRPKAMEKIAWHKAQGDDVVVVSASMRCWLQPWCESQGLAVISTELEVEENKLTGRFRTKNCHGAEKERRVKEVYQLNDYDHIYGYGDSSGDKALLALADKRYYKPFRD
jgi:phosphatidylglycerophosphatase C